jgi:hypothetical protein
VYCQKEQVTAQQGAPNAFAERPCIPCGGNFYCHYSNAARNGKGMSAMLLGAAAQTCGNISTAPLVTVVRRSEQEYYFKHRNFFMRQLVFL